MSAERSYPRIYIESIPTASSEAPPTIPPQAEPGYAAPGACWLPGRWPVVPVLAGPMAPATRTGRPPTRLAAPGLRGEGGGGQDRAGGGDQAGAGQGAVGG